MSDSLGISPRATLIRRLGLAAGPAVFVLILLFVELDPASSADECMAAVAALMAIWWITDAIPMAATSLLPVVLFPAFGVMEGKEIAPVYMNYVIFLFLGGFLIALAMERWNLHRRIALRIIRTLGSNPPRLVLGFMLATAFLSMWISNAATAIMMLAIGLAVIRQTEATFGKEKTAALAVALLLGIAYSASIGGMATLVGTPPNLALVRLFELSFPGAADAGYSISFGQWMLLGLPLSLTLLAVAWVILTKVCFRSPADLVLDPGMIIEEERRLGPMRFEEKAVLAVFASTALLWISREDLDLGTRVIVGWSSWLPFGSYLDDGTIAVAMALILFLIPARHLEGEELEHGTLLDASVFHKIPWHIILLFGGGFALAKGFQSSGLSSWVGAQFTGLESAPVPVIVAAICTVLTFLTEFTSNTATTEMVLPLLASIATATGIHPLLLMIPAAISASCAFMLPVATPPNAIVFSTGHIRMGQMVKAGLLLNVAGIVIVTGLFLLIGPSVFGIDPDQLPAWVK
jgi:solute carrier family 13 (sodium-dependent dicarboxylate transporter), member 2/3/5